MSKPETKPAQSLEEILASIRKALAEEEVQGGADSPAEAASPSAKQPVPSKGDPLSGQLAVALNGSGGHSAATATDDDLSDLLAPVAAKAAPPTETEPSPPPADDRKDPLWFLAPKPAAESEPAQDDKPSEPAAKTEPPAAEPEITLTRPEVLRSSLPPLFGADVPAEGKAEPVNFVKPAPEKHANFFSVGAPEKAKDEKREIKAPAAEKVSKPEAKSSEPVPTPPQSGAMLKPLASVPPAAEATASTLARPSAKEAPAAPADARALEGVIGQMLEPLIKSWLEANLPRLVEKVVREEVARTDAVKPDPAKS